MAIIFKHVKLFAIYLLRNWTQLLTWTQNNRTVQWIGVLRVLQQNTHLVLHSYKILFHTIICTYQIDKTDQIFSNLVNHFKWHGQTCEAKN